MIASRLAASASTFLLAAFLAPHAIADICIGKTADCSILEQVRAAYGAWEKAFEKGDATALAGLYAENAVIRSPTREIIQGSQDIEGFFDTTFAQGVRRQMLELVWPRELHEMVGGDLPSGVMVPSAKTAGMESVSRESGVVITLANWSATGTDWSGAEQSWSGVATIVFQRQPDQKLEIRLHTFDN